MAMMQNGGAGFLSGAAGGFFGSLGATAWSAGAGKFAKSTVGTIAFGALSGGVGAELTGGNFWQGAVTGGIVAGLNHVMHMVSSEEGLVARLKEAGISDPYAAASYENLDLYEFARKILPELYGEANSPQLEKAEKLYHPDGRSANALTIGGEYYPNREGGFISKIQVARSAFSSFLDLASSIGHELNHAADYFNGNMTRWYKKGGSGYAKSQTEFKAYSWQFNTLGSPVNISAYDSYRIEVGLWNKLLNGFN